MSLKIVPLKNFQKQVKALRKRYRSIDEDLLRLSEELRANPHLGVEIRQGVRKVRMSITSKGSGKSGGARVITCETIVTKLDDTLVLADIYDKSEQSSVSAQRILDLLRYEGVL